MQIAYLTNQYPAISHTFIRREIQALERKGLQIARYSVRPSFTDLIDPKDIEESKRTTYLVTARKVDLARDIFKGFFLNPLSALKTFGLAIKCGWRSEAGLIRHIIYFLEALVLSQWLNQNKTTHIHAHFGTNATTVTMLTATLMNIGFSFTVHGPEEFEKPGLIALKEKVTRAKFVAGISSFGASQLKMLVSPDKWERIKIVRCGLEEEFFNPPEKDNPPQRNTDFLCVGRLCAQKGQIDLVDAAALLKKNGHHFHLMMIGDGPMRSDIEKRIHHHGLEHEIELAGWKTQDEVRSALLQTKTFILPSYAEGLPVAIMEALGVKRPVISTYIAGIPELIVPESCGWLVPAGDVKAVAEAMEQALLISPDDYAAMGEVGKQQTMVMHHIDQEAAKLKQYFNDYHSGHQSASHQEASS